MAEPAINPEDQKEIPDKLYFRIGEVAQLVGVEPYVLRYWETEFSALHPKKSGTGHRLYRRKEVELLLRIKELLYEKRYTIEGAVQFLQAESKSTLKEKKKPAPRVAQRDLFAEDPLPGIRKELGDILALMS